MPHELIHTSAVRGIVLGSDGYCVVAETPGMPKSLRQQLERLSGYRHRVHGRHPDLINNPVSVSHVLVRAAGQTYHVLSRIADAGFDYSERTNYIAHHLAFTPDELPAEGPAWLAQQDRVFQTVWPSNRPPETLPASRNLPSGRAIPRKCEKWEELTGDGGWGGVLATTRSPVAVLYKLGQPILELIAESQALLPEHQRWQVTFSTYYTGIEDCIWQFMPSDSREANVALAGGAAILRLDRRMPGSPRGKLVSAARTGVFIEEVDEPESVSHISRRASKDHPRVGRNRQKTIPVDTEDNLDEAIAANGSAYKESDRYEDDEPIIPQDSRNTLATLKLLSLGLVCGVGFMFVANAAYELIMRKSLLTTLIGIESKNEENLKKDKNALNEQLKQSDSRATNAETRETTSSQKHAAEKERADNAVRQIEDNKNAAAKDVQMKLKAQQDELDAKYNKVISDLKQQISDLKLKLNIPPAPLKLEPLKMTPGVPTQVLNPGTKATLEVITGKLYFLEGTKLSSEESLTYTQQTGKLAAIGSEKAVPVLWAASVVKLTEEGAKTPRYYQLSEPETRPGVTQRGAGDKPYTFEWVDRKLASQKEVWDILDVGFVGEAKVRVGDKEIKLSGTSDDGKLPTYLVSKETEQPIRLEIKGGNLEVTLQAKPFTKKPADTLSEKEEISIIQAVLAPRKKIPELQEQQPVILRIIDPKKQ